jgi:hypothetical protein
MLSWVPYRKQHLPVPEETVDCQCRLFEAILFPFMSMRVCTPSCHPLHRALSHRLRRPPARSACPSRAGSRANKAANLKGGDFRPLGQEDRRSRFAGDKAIQFLHQPGPRDSTPSVLRHSGCRPRDDVGCRGQHASRLQGATTRPPPCSITANAVQAEAKLLLDVLQCTCGNLLALAARLGDAALVPFRNALPRRSTCRWRVPPSLPAWMPRHVTPARPRCRPATLRCCR